MGTKKRKVKKIFHYKVEIKEEPKIEEIKEEPKIEITQMKKESKEEIKMEIQEIEKEIDEDDISEDEVKETEKIIIIKNVL